MAADNQMPTLRLTPKGKAVRNFLVEIGEDTWRELKEKATQVGLEDAPLDEFFDWIMANRENAECPTTE